MIPYIIIAIVLSLQSGFITSMTGGEIIEITSGKFMASIYYRINNDTQYIYGCNGVIVHASYVLTTAECELFSFNIESLIIHFGQQRRNKGNTHAVAEIIRNNATIGARIALLRLNLPIHFRTLGRGTTVTLPEQDFEDRAGMHITVFGYQSTVERGYLLAKVTAQLIFGGYGSGPVFFARNSNDTFSAEDLGSAIFFNERFIGIVGSVHNENLLVKCLNMYHLNNFTLPIIYGPYPS